MVADRNGHLDNTTYFLSYRALLTKNYKEALLFLDKPRVCVSRECVSDNWAFLFS